MNNYFLDSGIFLKEVSKTVHDKIEHFQIIQQTMNLALGLERLLKGILYDVNPTYILIDSDFKNPIVR